VSDHYTPVFETEHGATRRCDCCACLQLRFGNTLLGLQPDDFEQLRAAVAAYDRGAAPLGPWPSDHAVIHVGDAGVGFVFSRVEIAELHRLLEGTRLLLDLGPGGRAAPT
jgi:hypothetical protein